MDSQRYDLTERVNISGRPSFAAPRRASVRASYACVDRHPLLSRIDAQRFDPFGRPSVSIRARASPGVLMGNASTMPKVYRRPPRHVSRMDSQRYDPSIRSKPVRGNVLTSSPEPIVRPSNDLSTLTAGTTRDGIFESRSNSASSSTSIRSQFSDTSTPWRTERGPPQPTEEEEHLLLGASRPRRFFVLVTPPLFARFLCGLDCRDSTWTTFDVVHPPESINTVPDVIRLS